MKYIFIVSTIVCMGLAVLLNVLGMWAGYRATPPGSVYLGTIHHPADYFYYLSQFTQGQDRGLARDLYSHEFVGETIVGWVNVWMGKIGHMVGLGSIGSYHLWVVILSLCLAGGMYVWFWQGARGAIRRNWVAFAALFFYLFNHLFAYPVRGESGIVWKQIDYWFNFGTPGQRMGGVPHHLFMHVVMVGVLSLVMSTERKTLTRREMAGVGMLLLAGGAALGSIQPLHWAMILLTTGGVGSIKLLVSLSRKNYKISSLYGLFWQPFFIFLGGIFPAITLYRIFQQLPFSQLPVWEYANSLRISPLHFFIGLGPVVVLAVFGAVVLRKKMLQIPTIYIGAYGILSFALFFSPVSDIVKLQNVRFLSSLTVGACAFIAGYGVGEFFKRFRSLQGVLIGVVLVLFAGVTLPSHILGIQSSLVANTKNAYVYVDKGVWEGFTAARKISGEDDIFAVMWPFHVSFPAVTGRTSYYGHPLLTIASESKGERNYHFFSHIMSVAQQVDFLKKEGIDFIVLEPWAWNELQIPNVEKVFDNGSLVIGKVRAEK